MLGNIFEKNYNKKHPGYNWFTMYNVYGRYFNKELKEQIPV